MKHPVTDFLRSALIPELCADITAGTSCNVHFILIGVAAVRTSPNELALFLDNLDFSVPTAFLTVVALCVKLCINNVVVNELHNRENSVDIVLHIGNFNVAYCTAGRKLLELRLKFELVESGNILRNVNVIAVCDISLVRNSRNYTETALETFCEFVGR